MNGRENGFIVAIAYILVFLLINFDRDFGLIFSIMGIVAFLVYKDDHSHQIPVSSRKGNLIETIAWSMIGYGVFIAATVLITSFVAPQLLATSTSATQSILFVIGGAWNMTTLSWILGGAGISILYFEAVRTFIGNMFTTINEPLIKLIGVGLIVGSIAMGGK